MVAQLFQRAPQQARPATPLLTFVAGDFADSLARIWPAPHGDFFALPAARRHAAAILIAAHGRRQMPGPELRRLVEYQRDAVVAEAIMGVGSHGLMRALSKAGEQLWKPDDYRIFLALFAEPMGNEVLRHLDEIRPEAFGPVAALPEALRLAPIVRALPATAAAADLAHAFRLAVLMREPESAARIVRSWSAGGDTAALFRRAADDLTPDVFRPATPPPALGAPFVRIAGRKQLEAMALEFRNCLADQAGRIADGRLAVYVWRGEPLAAVAISRDAAGWRLAEAKAPDNVDLEEAFLHELVARLGAAGVRTGPSVQSIQTRLDDWACGNRYPAAYRPDFIESLALGDLWS